MAITYLDQYGLQGGTTALTLTPPAGTASGDLAIIFVANKNSSTTPTTPAGWTLLGQQAVGTGADGNGTGPIKLSAWWQVLAGVAVDTGITITGANRTVAGGMVYRKAGGDPVWAPTISFGSDTISDTSFSATVAANLGVSVGDYLLSVGVLTVDTTLPGRDVTIPGVTSTYTGINSAGGVVGNQIYLWTDHRVSASGNQSGASGTIATTGIATTGGAFNIRVSLGGALAVQNASQTQASTPVVVAPALTTVDPRGPLWTRKDLKVGSCIGAWELNGGFAFNNATAATNTAALKLKVIRYHMWRTPTALGGTQDIGTMQAGLDNIIATGALPLVGLPPIWNEQYPGQPDPWSTAWQRLMIDTATAKGVVLFELGNEPDNYGGLTGQQYFNQLWSGVPAHKAYARGLGKEIFIGGPSWANFYAGPNMNEVKAWLTACKNAYLLDGNRDWLPDFVSFHTYLVTPTDNDTLPHVQTRVDSWQQNYLDMKTFIDTEFAGLYDRGFAIKDQLRLADTEYNSLIDNASTINDSQTFTDYYIHAMFTMFANSNLFIANQFTIASHTGGAFDLLNTSGNPKPLYNSYFTETRALVADLVVQAATQAQTSDVVSVGGKSDITVSVGPTRAGIAAAVNRAGTAAGLTRRDRGA